MKVPRKKHLAHDALMLTILRLNAPMHPEPTGLTPQLAPLAPIRAVFFDIYGTMFISGSGDIGTVQAGAKENALLAALKATGFKGDLATAAAEGARQLDAAIHAAHETAHARGIAQPEVDIQAIWHTVFQALLEQGMIPSMPPDNALMPLMIEYECRVNPVWPMPNIRQALAALQTSPHPKIMGIVSNAQFYTKLLFEAFFKSTPVGMGFPENLCAWSYQARQAKPAPAMFNRVLTRLEKRTGISPEETVYIGNDMLNDVWAAREAGMKTILFAGDRRSLRLREDDPRCRDLKPDRVITDWDQLTAVLPAGPIS